MKNIFVLMSVCSFTILMTIACNAQQPSQEKQHNKAASSVPSDTGTQSVTGNEFQKLSQEFNHGYMVLPGFTPTGNAETDDQNYAKAKKEFVAQYPEDYIQRMQEMTEAAQKEWMSKQTPVNTVRDSNVIQISKSRFDNMTEAEKKRITDNPKQFNIVED